MYDIEELVNLLNLELAITEIANILFHISPSRHYSPQDRHVYSYNYFIFMIMNVMRVRVCKLNITVIYEPFHTISRVHVINSYA